MEDRCPLPSEAQASQTTFSNDQRGGHIDTAVISIHFSMAKVEFPAQAPGRGCDQDTAKLARCGCCFADQRAR